eukprot:TRINITY_DN108387_c0_g1_i1.p1 TRINITY_DN108387_c0_g1~~TRINITY_DN108387_c0_g1_i1.p1  ORF type:complete len:664 (+),score=125.20 TRINITY_DN108387_c0_g1_i1:54-2045(+)
MSSAAPRSMYSMASAGQLFVLRIASLSITGVTAHCQFDWPLLPGLPPRVVPVPKSSRESFEVAYQYGETIYLQQRAGDSCKSIGSPVQVNQSLSFLQSPSESGLADAVHLGNGATAVAWVLNKDLWLRVMNGSSGGEVVRASQLGSQGAAHVRMVADPNGSGFLVGWSSWQQQKDSDGWGAVVRRFNSNGLPVSSEMQLSSTLDKFQWHMQLAWCGTALWALWLPQAACQNGRCSNHGPLLRFLGRGSNESLNVGPEIDLQGDGALNIALTCSDEEAASIWLDKDGDEIRWNYTDPPKESLQVVSPQVPTLSQSWLGFPGLGTFAAAWSVARRSLPEFLAQQASASIHVAKLGSRHAEQRRKVLTPQVASQVEAAATPGSLGSPVPRKALQEPGPGQSINPGSSDTALAAQNDLLLLLQDGSTGKVEAQLLNFGSGHEPLLFPAHDLQNAPAVEVRAAWDSAPGPTVFLCWGSISGDNRYWCRYESAGWLAGADRLGISGELTILALFTCIFVMCLMKQCAQNGHFGQRHRAAMMARREASEAQQQRRAERSAARARMTQLREQISQIPMVPLPNRPPASTAEEAPVEVTDAQPQVNPQATGDGGDASPSNPCPICQNEVVVRVALQRCGHTACRDCTLRLVELAQPCHICRGPIEGVLPVYL